MKDLQDLNDFVIHISTDAENSLLPKPSLRGIERSKSKRGTALQGYPADKKTPTP